MMKMKGSKCLAALALAAGLVEAHAATTVFVTGGFGGVESEGVARVRVIREGDRTNAFTVDYLTATNGTAIPGVNFLPRAGTIAFVAGEREKFIDVTLLNDGLVNFGELWFGLRLTNASAGIEISRSYASVSVADSQYSAAFDLRFVPDLDGRPVATLQRANGQFLVAVWPYQQATQQWTVKLVVLNADGTRAEEWPTTFDSSVYSLIEVANGKVLAAGDFTQIGGLPRPSLARLNPDGSVDPTFVPNLTGGGVGQAVALPDGRILAAIAKDLRTSPISWTVIRLNPDGQPDDTFKSPQLEGGRLKIVADPQGRILLGGDFDRISETARTGLARLKSDGSLDRSFSPMLQNTGLGDKPDEDVSWLPHILDLAVQPEGRILIAGGFTTVNGQERRYLARLDQDGSTDETFHYRPAVPWVRSVQVETDGTVLAAGDDGLQRLAPDGTRLRAAATGGHVWSLVSSGDEMAVVAWSPGEPPPRLSRVLLDQAPRTAVAMSRWNYGAVRFDCTEPPDGQHLPVTVFRLGDVTEAASVMVTTRDATAKAGEDYAAITQTLNFAPFEQQKEIEIPAIFADDVFDPDETFELHLIAVTGVEAVATPVTVKIHEGRASVFPDKIKRLPDGGVEVAFYSSPARNNYVLEASSDLRTWSRVTGDPTPDLSLGPNRYRLVDRQAGAAPARFYQLKAAP